MSSTELAERPPENAAGASVALFAGATPQQIIEAAREVATLFSDIVKSRRLFTRIGDRDHIHVEAWQTIGTLTGCYAVEAGGGVTELPWPEIDPVLGEEPPLPGEEPKKPKDDPEWQAWKAGDEDRKDWEHHRKLLDSRKLGRGFGYSTAFRVVKGGQAVGWGEGRCDRAERTWAGRDDYSLASMAQTRAQSRALGAPLRFVIELAGYDPQLPDDVPQDAPQKPTQPDLPWGPVVDSDEDLEKIAKLVELLKPGIDAPHFVLAMGSHFDGVPEACVTMLKGLVRATPPEKPAGDGEQVADAEVVED